MVEKDKGNGGDGPAEEEPVPPLEVLPGGALGPGPGVPEVKHRGRAAFAGGARPPMDVQVYERLWTVYRDGVRQPKALARACGVTEWTATRAIRQGWPDQKLPPLAERVELFDRERAAIEAKAATEKFKETIDEFYKARRKNLTLVAGTTGLAGAAMVELHKALKSATFTKVRAVRRVVVDKDGEKETARVVVVDESYIPAQDVIAGVRAIASAVRDLGEYERRWLIAGQSGIGGHEPGKDGETSGDLPAILTPEQAQYVQDHNGALPPDVTEEQVVATLAFFGLSARSGT